MTPANIYALEPCLLVHHVFMFIFSVFLDSFVSYVHVVHTPHVPVLSSPSFLAKTSVSSPRSLFSFSKKKSFQDQSVQKVFYLILKMEALVLSTVVPWRYGGRVSCLVRTHVYMYIFGTLPHPHGHWQLQELLGNHTICFLVPVSLPELMLDALQYPAIRHPGKSTLPLWSVTHHLFSSCYSTLCLKTCVKNTAVRILSGRTGHQPPHQKQCIKLQNQTNCVFDTLLWTNVVSHNEQMNKFTTERNAISARVYSLIETTPGRFHLWLRMLVYTSNASVFKIKLNAFWILWSRKYFFR